MAAGLLAPAEGEVRVSGRTLTGVNREAGYLFQADALMPWKDALEQRGGRARGAGRRAAQAKRQAEEWLARVGLKGFGDRYPHQMSGGMRKRTALAQMLIREPPILLMDEPFSALDIQTRHLMENQLLELWSGDRKSVLFITHDLEEAISLSGRVLLLSAGPAARPDRRVRGSAAAAARRRRDPHDRRIPWPAPRDLVRPPGRGAKAYAHAK